jgi:hypothetical protein
MEPSATSTRYGLPGCLNCGPVELHPVFDGELTNFYCPLCGSCWHLELGFVSRVYPGTCPGCRYELQCGERRSRPDIYRQEATD